MTRTKWNTATFKAHVESITNGEYTFIGDYINGKTPSLMRHNTKGCVWEVRPANFLNGNRCLECSGRAPKGIKDVEEGLRDLGVLQDFVIHTKSIKNLEEDIRVTHLLCETPFTAKARNLMLTGTCPECFPQRLKRLEEVREGVRDALGEDYVVISTEYLGNTEPLEVYHKVCDDVFNAPYKTLRKGHGCPICSGHLKTHEDYVREVHALTKGEFSVAEQYSGARVPIRLTHTLCGKDTPQEPNRVLTVGARCSHCHTSSKGERLVQDILDELNVSYIHESTIKGCYHKRPLRFDFVILDKEGLPLKVIEYDGIQHYEPIGVFGGEEGLRATKLRDHKKDVFCSDNGIPLLRLPYTLSSEDVREKIIEFL